MFRVDENCEGLMNPLHRPPHNQQQQQAVNPFSNSGSFFFSGHFDDQATFDAPMHRNMISDKRVLDVPYDVGLCEEFLRMQVVDQHPCCSSNNGRIRVDPEVFMPGFSDPVRGWGQGWDVSDSVGPTRFLPGRNSVVPLMVNDVEMQRPFVGDGVLEKGGWTNLELDLLYRMNMLRQRPFVGDDGPSRVVLENGGLGSLELDLLYNRLQLQRQRPPGLRPMIPNPVLPLSLQLPVESLSNEGSFVLDSAGHGGQCSKCLAEMKSQPKRSKSKKKNARNDQSVMSSRMFSEDGLQLDDQISLQGTGGSTSRLLDFQGNIYSLCKDQLGCRFLQKVLEGGSFREVDMVFAELIDHVVDLMVDPFANYVVQKLLEVCTEEHRMAIVFVVTRLPGELCNICLDCHGTRVVQKLVQMIKCRKHISMIIFALKPHLLELIKDLNGNHVVQRCLQCLGSEHTKVIYDTATNFCVDIATHQHGCCVLNRCIAYSGGRFREMLISNICANGLLLAQDSYGNYVIQYIIELKHPPAAASLISQFEGRFAYLSMQKFSSHVVEKCIRFIEASHPRIIQDFISFPHFDQLIQDRFANYVIQSALEVIKGSLRLKLVEAIRPYEGLRSSPYCKKIFSRNLLKK